MVIPWAMAPMFLMTDMLLHYSGCGRPRITSQEFVSSLAFFALSLLPTIRSSYQRPPHIRGHGNLLPMIETLAARLLYIGRRDRGVSSYGLPRRSSSDSLFLRKPLLRNLRRVRSRRGTGAGRGAFFFCGWL